jgi:hypothetical protein
MSVIRRMLRDATPCSLLNKYRDFLEKHTAFIPGVDIQTTGSSDTSVFASYAASHTGRLIFILIVLV